jgi:Ca2+-binding EF-hand superfamily protein
MLEEQEELNKLELMHQIYRDMDTDNSGSISWEELSNFLTRFAILCNQPQPSEKQVNMLFKLLDENKDGSISMKEMEDVLE